MSDIVEAVDRLIAEGSKAPEVITLPDGGEKLIVIPDDSRVIPLQPFCPPQRVIQSVSLAECDSFVGYVNQFKTDATQIFVGVDFGSTGMSPSLQVRAVLDYHQAVKGEKAKPDYCSHIAHFRPIPSPEWEAWRLHNGQYYTQVEFASFLEDQQHVFVEPKGAELLELVRSLHGHKNARFNQSVRLDNGASSVSYEEDIVVRGGSSSRAGEIELPAVIMAGFPIFVGSPAYRVRARLKTRITDRRLELRYETIQPQAIVRDNVLELVKTIGEKTGIIPLLGNP